MPFLAIVCDDLEDLENGMFRLSHTKDGPPLEGTDVIYKCDEGFKLEGSFTRHCLKDGSWSGRTPECKGKGIIILIRNAEF